MHVYNLIHSHANGYSFTSQMLAQMPEVSNP